MRGRCGGCAGAPLAAAREGFWRSRQLAKRAHKSCSPRLTRKSSCRQARPELTGDGGGGHLGAAWVPLGWWPLGGLSASSLGPVRRCRAQRRILRPWGTREACGEGKGGKRRNEKLPSALKALLAHSVSSSAPERADAVNHEALYVPGGEEGKHRTPAR